MKTSKVNSSRLAAPAHWRSDGLSLGMFATAGTGAAAFKCMAMGSREYETNAKTTQSRKTQSDRKTVAVRPEAAAKTFGNPLPTGRTLPKRANAENQQKS